MNRCRQGNFADTDPESEVGRDGWDGTSVKLKKPPSGASHHRLPVSPLSGLEEWLAGLQVGKHNGT